MLEGFDYGPCSLEPSGCSDWLYWPMGPKSESPVKKQFLIQAGGDRIYLFLFSFLFSFCFPLPHLSPSFPSLLDFYYTSYRFFQIFPHILKGQVGV